MQTYRRNRVTALLILNLGTTQMSAVSLMHWLLYPLEKSHQYAQNMKPGGPRSLSGYFGEETSLVPAGI